MIFIHPEQSV